MRKVVINTLIGLICTAIIFYLHFAVYDGMLLQEPFFTGSICAICIVFALRSNIDDQTYTTQWNYPTAFLRIRLYQLLWCTIAVSIPVILITEPYHFEYWFALTCIVVIALISKLHLKTVPAVPVTVMVTMLVTMGVFLLVVHPISTSNAEKLVEQAGYTDRGERPARVLRLPRIQGQRKILRDRLCGTRTDRSTGKTRSLIYMEYKIITKPDGSEQKLAVYDGKCRFWMEGLYDSLPDTAEKRAEECSLPVKIDRREDGTVSVGTQSLVPWETDYGKLEIMADVYLNYLAQVFNLPDDDYVKTRLEFGSDSADRDSLMTAEEKEIISANK